MREGWTEIESFGWNSALHDRTDLKVGFNGGQWSLWKRVSNTGGWTRLAVVAPFDFAWAVARGEIREVPPDVVLEKAEKVILRVMAGRL